MSVVIGLSIWVWLICGFFSFRLCRYRLRDVKMWTPRFTAAQFSARLLLGPIGVVPVLVSQWRPKDFEVLLRMQKETATGSWNRRFENRAVTKEALSCVHCGEEDDCCCERHPPRKSDNAPGA